MLLFLAALPQQTTPPASREQKTYAITVTTPNHPVPLAHPLTLTVHLPQGANLTSFSIAQSDPRTHMGYTNERTGFVRPPLLTGDISDDGTSRLLHADAMTRVFEIIPLQPGQRAIEISALSADGSFAHQIATLDVAASSQDLASFRLHGFPAAALVLTGDPHSESMWLSPILQYRTLKFPIYLADSTLIHLRVEPPANALGEPSLRVDPNGLVHALHVGKATVIGTFAGVESRIDITVYTRENAPAGYIVPKP